MNKKDDKHQVDTTGHSWDGIEEYNNPLPKWWLYIFYACIVWGIGYTIAYPAWPLLKEATPGLLGYSTRANVAADIDAVNQSNAELTKELSEIDLNILANNDELDRFATNWGAAVFRAHCSQCHGSGAAGVQGQGYPNLLDDDWLWGGTIEEVAYTVRHGIRNETDDDAHWSQMPAFGDMLEKDEIKAVVQHVLAISGADHDAALAATGATVYADNCASCHADDGTGDVTQGAPNLTDAIWLYGGSKDQITETVKYSRFGVMPAWGQRLSDAEVKAVAAYVHQLGGGL